MKKSLLLLAIFLIFSCDKNSDEPIIKNYTINQSVKINVPIGPHGDFTTTYTEFDFSPLYEHTNNTYNIKDIVVNSVSYRFKNLNRYDNIILDSYSISFNGIEIENVTNENSLLQLISRGEINLTRDNEFFDNLAESILINSYVHASSFGIMQWDGNYNKFEIEVIINIDVISDY